MTGRAVLARHALAELLVGGALGSIEAIELGTVFGGDQRHSRLNRRVAAIEAAGSLILDCRTTQNTRW